MTLATTLFVVSGTLLALTYGGFAAILGLVAVATRPFRPLRAHPSAGADTPAITVYFAALNEEENIQRRLDNIFDTDYDTNKLHVVVISDGSADGTADVTRRYIAAYPDRKVTLVDLPENKGKAHAQNILPAHAHTKIVVGTDADASFRRDTLPRLIAPFRDPRVSAVGAVVVYRDPGNSSVAYGYGKYRNVERMLRSWESELGILVKVDGPCVAYRLSIWEEIQPFEDADQVLCLWAQSKNVSAVQADDAICYDWANRRPDQEIKQRARMTRKALLSTFNRWTLSHALRHPAFTVALWLHKIIRFFSPILVILLLASAAATCVSCLVVALALVALAAASNIKARRAVTAFVWAQVSFASGILGWIRNDRSGAYRPTRTIQG